MSEPRRAYRFRSGNSPAFRLPSLLLIVALLAFYGAPLQAAFTAPRLALTQVTSFHSASGGMTLDLQGTFSFADAVQLAVPVNVIVKQGQLTARFDLSGNVFTSRGRAEQAAPGPGVIRFAQRNLTLVLPPGFVVGAATAQIAATFDGKLIASNLLRCTL